MNPELIKEISFDDLPEAYQVIAEIIGIENTVKLSEYLGGLSFYFPKLNGLFQRKRDTLIRKEFNGSNFKDLAKKYDLSESWVRQILQNGKSE